MTQHPEDQLRAELAELRSQLAVARGRLAELETTDAEPTPAEWRARVSARQWRATFDAISDPVFLMDAGGTIVRCNQALIDHLDKPRSAIIGRHCRELMQATTGSVEGCPYEQALKTMQRATVEWQLDERWFEATVDPMLDDDGYLIGFVHVQEDITERKRAEQARRRRNLELGLLHRAAQAFGSTLDLEELLTTVLEEVRRALDVDGCSIWLSDSQTRELVCHGAAGLGSEIVQGWRLAPGEGFVGWVIGHGKSLIVPDARADERHFKGVDVETGLEVRSVLAVPLRVKDQVIGTLEAVDAEVGHLDAADRRLLEPLAASAAIAIQNARLYEAAEAEIAERKRAEAALRESEQHYRVLFEHLPIPVFTKNRQGEYTSCNAENQRYWDVDPVGRTDAEILAPEVATALREADLRVMETGDVLTVEEYLPGTPLGDRQVLTRKASLRDRHGNTVGILGASVDITERKQAEEALRESQERFKSLVDTMNDGLSLLDETGTFSYVNDRFCEMLGYSRDELMGSHHLRVVADEHTERHRKILRERMEGKSEVYETVFKRKDGESVPVILAGSPLFDRDGNYRGAIGAATDITERKQAEEALRESEERYRSLFEKTPIGLYRTTPDGTILEANPALVTMLGYGDRGSLLAASALDLYVDPDDRGRGLRELEAADEWASTELRLRRRDGRIIWVLDSGRVTRDDEGRIRYFDGALEDITERRQAEEALRRRAEELAALQATVLDITAQHDLPSLLQTVVERAAELLDARAGGMYLCDHDREEARCVVSYNTPDDYTGTVLKYGEGAAGTVAQTREPLIIDDYRTWSGRAATYEEEQPFTAVLSVPMMWQGQVTGVVHVLRDVETPRFTEAELGLLTLFANHAAIAVENARLLEHARREIAERRRTEQALRESEEKYKLVSENIPVVVYSALPDEHSTSIFLSGRAEELTGYSVEEFLEHPGLWASVVHPEDAASVWESINDHRRNRTTLDVEYRVITRDGATKWIRDKAEPALDENGEIVRIDGFMEDVTERKQAEEALRDSEKRFRDLYENAPNAYLSIGGDGRIRTCNRRAGQLLGYEVEELVGRSVFELYADTPQGRGKALQVFDRFRDGEPISDEELQMQRADGNPVWISLTVNAVRDAQGQVVESRSMVVDITERMQALEALRRSEYLLRQVLDTNPAVLFVKDYDSRVLLANKTMARFYNLSVEEVTGELQSDLHRRHGADPNDIHKWLADDREVIETGQPIHLVETGTDSENRLHWFETAKYPIDIGQGRCGALVISQDITERKLAEEALRESKQLLERTFASLHDAVFIVDAETVEILDCNPAASRMFGHGRQEMLGRTTAFLHVGEASLQEFRARLYPAVEEKGFLVLPESRMKRKDGTVFPTEHSVMPLENDQGQCVGWVSVVRDITHRKQTEEALRRREQDMRLIADNAPALVSYVDAEGCYRFVNKQYEEWFDMPRTEIIGKHCSDILGEAAYEAIRERVETVLSGQRVRYEEALPYMRGGPRWVIAEYVPDVDEQGHVNGFFALVTDITERKRAEQALRRSAEETARSQRMLLALSQAAQAVQRAHTSEEVFHTVGDEITKLGYQATVLTLADDREHLMVSFLTFESALVRAAERLTGLLAQDYTFPLVPGGFFQRLITEGGTAFTEGTAEPLAQALPKPVRPLVGRLADLLKWEESIVVPLKTGGEVFGLLAVTGAGLTEADVPAVTAFANQAAIALENARLYEAERSAHEQLRHLASHLRDAREQERKRVAREIHDELGQSLTALKFDISRLARQLPEGEPVLRERVAAMAALIDGSIHTVQRVSTELRPGLLDDLGLAAAIEWQVDEFAERTGIRCDLHLSEEDVRLESDVATALFRILQETLTNVARHAGANEVQVELAVDPREVVLKVRDDGRGITESEISSTQALGLLGMRERARTLGGEVTFEGVRGQGTTVTVRIPYDLTRMTRMDESEA